MIAEIQRLRAARRGIVMSTHDPDRALQLVDRIALLHDGRLIADEPPERAVSPERLRTLHGVDVAMATVSDMRGTLHRIFIPAGPAIR